MSAWRCSADGSSTGSHPAGERPVRARDASDPFAEARVRVVLFDVGGTLLRVEPSVGEVYAQAAAKHGFLVDTEKIERRFAIAWNESQERGRERGHVCSDEILREEWFRIVRRTFGDRVPEGRMQELFEDLYERFVTPAAWKVVPRAHETMSQLRARGVSIGVLSNWDSRLPVTLQRLGLLAFLDFFVVSYAVGHEKPHPRIFEEAIRRAAVEPQRILHIGDSWESDIEPARRLDLRTLWIAPAEHRARRPDGGPGAESLAELVAADWEELLS